jgi:HNH endonuclease/AP2 domain
VIRPFTGCLLTKGRIAFYDLEDSALVERHKWFTGRGSKDEYAATVIRLNGKRTTLFMARLILGLKHGDKREADHKNHNTLDNRKENLRIVTRKQNNQNREGVKGYSKEHGKFRAQIMVDQKTIKLGTFDTEAEARQAYLDARKEHGFLT